MKTKKYSLTEEQIDIISHALKNRIDYLQGILMIMDKDLTPAHRELLRQKLEATKAVQEITTYPGQPEEYLL